MAHINDLDKNVLAQILYKAVAAPAKNLSEWKAKLPLLAVCRKWTELALSFVFYQVFVELPKLPGPSLDAHFLWTSNVELLISRGCVLRALCLTIQLPYDVTPDHIRIIALEILKLDRVDWQHINSLAFTFATWTLYLPDKPGPQDDKTVTDVARTARYFAQNLRNVVDLDLVLELELDSSAVRILPSICGETLKVLKLSKVPRNFAWHHFRYDIFDLPIVFRQLTALHLSYEDNDMPLTEGEVQDKIASGARCCDQLYFPALRELAIRNCTPDCDLLYADIPFPELKKVVLSGSISSIRHCSRLRFTNIGDLEVDIISPYSDEAPEIYNVTNHFFSNIHIGRAAFLCVSGDKFILDPDEMRWVNISKLELPNVEYTTVCKAIGQLPNLCELAIHRLATNSPIEDSSLFTSADPMLAWGEKLVLFHVRNFSDDSPLAVCIDDIQALLLHAGALKKLAVPESVHRLVVAFIDMYKDRYPHLANVTVY
ncbi:hypothetical protein GGH13_003432 [Coemansia sp. S155-1]|nr:hypothetical protein GGH13_003432 [Coemansia sp. S155-1]